MAGFSSRFSQAGYSIPKYMLDLWGRPAFDWAVRGFERYFDSDLFIFILSRAVWDSEEFVRERCASLGIVNSRIVVLDAPTRGQAETVALGLVSVNASGEDDICVFNIDTLRPGFDKPTLWSASDGWLEAFVGPGDGWSFVQPSRVNQSWVAATAEKRRISPYCSTGMYWFRRFSTFLDAFAGAVSRLESGAECSELYIAPLFNDLLSDGLLVTWELISQAEVFHCGVPAEYEILRRSPMPDAWA